MVALLALLRRFGSLLVLSVGAGYVAFTAAPTPAGVRLETISFTCAFPWALQAPFSGVWLVVRQMLRSCHLRLDE